MAPRSAGLLSSCAVNPLASVPPHLVGLAAAELPWRHESSICRPWFDPLAPLDYVVLADIRAWARPWLLSSTTIATLTAVPLGDLL